MARDAATSPPADTEECRWIAPSDQPATSGVAARLPNAPGSQKLTPPWSARACPVKPIRAASRQAAAQVRMFAFKAIPIVIAPVLGSIRRLRLREFPFAVEDFRARTIEPHGGVPA